MTESGVVIDGKYRLEVELGRGVFGCVYKAKQMVLGRDMRDVALKLFHADVISEENVDEQMRDALSINALLSHVTDWEIRQHFLTVYDMGLTQDDPPRAFIAMELVREGSLSNRIRDFGRFSLQGTLHYLKQLVRAMAFMHRHKFVHSDLKPDNVLLFRHRGQDHVKIGDFGLAGRYYGIFGRGPKGGDMDYMAPELIAGMNTTPGCDVFSLGILTYEMLTGESPYLNVGKTLTQEEREDDEKMRDLRLKARREPLRLLRGDFPELSGGEDAGLAPLLDIINRMLEPDVSRRYESAEQVEADLRNLLGESSADKDREHVTDASINVPVVGNTQAADSDVLELTQQCESAIGVGNWATANETARKLIQLQPELPDGYELKSRTLEKQAAEAEGDAQPEKVVVSMRKQALRTLQRGIKKCPGADARRHLSLRAANLHRVMGDDATAEAMLSNL